MVERVGVGGAAEPAGLIDVERVRERFPALASGDAVLDNPAGTQVPLQVTERMVRYLLETNANHGGAYATSRASDALVAEARAGVASFLGARESAEVVFGPNMTTLTFQMSRSVSREWQAGDEVVVTRLDHDANVAPWIRAAEDRGANVRYLDFDPRTGRWSVDDLRRLVSGRTRLVAVGWASNALGSVNDVSGACRVAREAGALSYVDAVHWAPHGPIDVTSVGCDFLACSAYKFFGPHLGILWGRRELLDRLTAYKVRPAEDTPPGKWETGTGAFESIAGTLGALEYLSWIGYGAAPRDTMSRVREHEKGLSAALLSELSGVPGLTIHGPAEPSALDGRVPTFSFTVDGLSPRRVAEELGARGIRCWDGNYYAVSVTERLGLEGSGGMVRVGAVHYNTVAEVRRLSSALHELMHLHR